METDILPSSDLTLTDLHTIFSIIWIAYFLHHLLREALYMIRPFTYSQRSMICKQYAQSQGPYLCILYASSWSFSYWRHTYTFQFDLYYFLNINNMPYHFLFPLKNQMAVQVVTKSQKIKSPICPKDNMKCVLRPLYSFNHDRHFMKRRNYIWWHYRISLSKLFS